MPKSARLRRMDDRPGDTNPIVFIPRLGPARWPRVPPWRPRMPVLPPPGDKLPSSDRPEAGRTSSQPPSLTHNGHLDTAT